MIDKARMREIRDKIFESHKKSRWGEYNTLLSALIESTERWALEHNKDEAWLELRATDAALLVEDFQRATNRKNPLDDTAAEEFLSDTNLWDDNDPRNDPLWVFENGRGDPLKYTKINKDLLWRQIKTYFMSPWLVNPRLEYLFVRALVFEHIVEYGEVFKGLMKQQPIRKKLSIIKWLVIVSGFLSIPLYLLRSNAYDYYLANLFVVALVALLVAPRCKVQAEDPVVTMSANYQDMILIWATLRGPLVHPFLLKQHLLLGQLKPAGWNPVDWNPEIYCLLDVWIQRNASVFFVSGEIPERC